MPVGAYGASAEIMAKISPEGEVYQAGTLSGNPVAMSAGIAQLTECLKQGFYEALDLKTKNFVSNILAHTQSKSYSFNIFYIGSIFWFAFTSKEKIQSAEAIDPESMEKFRKLHKEMLERGVYFGPSGYEVGFVSEAHDKKDLQTASGIICECLDIVCN